MKTVFRSMSKREWVFITILFILSWLIPNVQSDDYLTPEMGVEIRQVNFDYEKAPWSNSSWGQIVVDVLSLVENTQLKQGYLNILSPLGWHLVNMPIVLEQARTQPLAISYFNLGLGDQEVIAKLSQEELMSYLQEVSSQLKEFQCYITYTESPLYEIPKGELLGFPVSNSIVWDAQGASELSVSVISIPPAIRKVIEFDPKFLDYKYTEDHSINIDAAVNQCFPMSVANSLQYLEKIFDLPIPNDHVPGLYGDESLVGQLDTAAGRAATSRTSGPGTWFTPMVRGKFQYLNRHEISDLLVQKYQGRGWGATPDQALPAGDYTAFGSTLVDEGEAVTWDWIVEQIKTGEDVELVFSFDNAQGVPTGGHAVRIYECGTVAGKPYIKYLHDRNQSNDNAGLETVQVFLEDLDGDGLLNLGSVNREIRFAMSESIKEKPTTPTNTSTPEPTPTHTPILTRPTSTDTPTPSPTNTPSPTPTEVEPPEPISDCPIYFSIEEPYVLPSGGTHGDILLYTPGSPASVLPGGSNPELLKNFITSNEEALKADPGLDGFDILELDPLVNSAVKGIDHKIVFSVEKAFKINNTSHSADGYILSDGDLLFTNGGVILAQALFAPLQLLNANGGVIESLGVDALELEGFLNIFNSMENRIVGDLHEFLQVTAAMPALNIYFSFEETNEEYVAGAGSLLPVDTKVSADDLIRLHISSSGISARVERSGMDMVPSTSPSLFVEFRADSNMGLDGVASCLPENQAYAYLKQIYFSTELDDNAEPVDFGEGDLLLDGSTTPYNQLIAFNKELTGNDDQKWGLDGLDLYPERIEAIPTATKTHTPTFTPTLTPTFRPGTEGCVTAGEFYTTDMGGLSTVHLGPVEIQQAYDVSGIPMDLSVTDCSGDGALDVSIPWSDVDAGKLAAIVFSTSLCEGNAPKRVEVTLKHGYRCSLVAYNDDGVQVDTVAAADDSNEQTLELSSESGIRKVEVVGAEICILKICWYCDITVIPTPTYQPDPKGCVQASDLYTTEVDDLPSVNLGAVEIRCAVNAFGKPVYLHVNDCSGDKLLDVQVPWTESSAAQLASILFSTNLCGGKAPQRVEVVLQHGYYCKLIAYDDAGNVVDTEAAAENSAVQTLVLTSASGIRMIEIMGAEICILKVCWLCEYSETPTPTPTLPSGEGLGPEDGIQFNQVDFLFEDSLWLNSSWGRLQVNPSLLMERTKITQGFLNVFSDQGWHVANMLVDRSDIGATANQASSFVTYFNLGLVNPDELIGKSDSEIASILREKSVQMKEWKAFVVFTSRPLQQMPDVELNQRTFALGENWIWDAQGVSELATSIYNLPPLIYRIPEFVWDSLFESYTEPQSVNVETANNQCFPMAVANSLQYLENEYSLNVPNNHVMGLKGDSSLVGQLDTYAGRSVTDRRHGSGTWFTPMIDGKFKYLQDKGLSSSLVHKYQGRGWGSTPNQALPAGNHTAFGSTVQDNGAVVTYEWIREQIKAGEDVELIFSYDNASGNPTGGHAVRVFECGKILGRPYVKYLHDSNQGNDSAGLETVQVYLEDLDGDGIPNLGSASREVRFALSESMKVKPIQIFPNWGLLFSQVHFIFGENELHYSNWGRMEIETKRLGEYIGSYQGYINVFSEKGWLVVNLPIDFFSIRENPNFVIYFNMGLPDEEQNEPVKNLNLYAQFSLVPLEVIPDDLESLVKFVNFDVSEPVIWDALGIGPSENTIISTAPSLISRAILDISYLFEKFTEDHTKNVETAYNQCFPMSVANSLQYLEDIFGIPIPNNHVMGLKGDSSLVGQLDTYANRSVTNRRSGSGTWFTPMVNGKFKYLADHNLTGLLVQKYQGKGWGNPPNEALPDGNYTAHGSTLVDEGDFVTYAWIREQIKNGEDVELVFSYDDSNGNATGGHAVRVFECGRVLGKPYVKYLHDRNQNNDSDGLEEVLVYIEDLDGDGMLNLGSVNREIRFAMSESALHVEPTPTSTSKKPTPTNTRPIVVLPTRTPIIIRPTSTPTPTPTIGIVWPKFYDDLVVAQGFGGKTIINVRYYNEETGALSSIRKAFSGIPDPFLARIGGGQGRTTYLSVGDLNQDGTQDIVSSFGPTQSHSEYPNIIVVRDSETKQVIGNSFVAFTSTQYNGGEVRTAVGDFIGSGTPQIAVVEGYGGNGLVRLYQYTTNPPPNSWQVVGQFNGLPSALIEQTGIVGDNTEPTKILIGLTVAAGDLDQDGLDELVIGQTSGPQSQTIFHVLDINNKGGIADRYIYAGFKTKFRGEGGIELQVADLNGDTYPEIIVGSMGNLRNHGDERDTVPLNLVGIISPIVENNKIYGFMRPAGKSVFNAFTENINPSGAVTLAVGEFNGDINDGKEIAVGTSAYMQFDGTSLSFLLPPSEPRYKIMKIKFDGGTVNEIQTLGPTNGYIAFVGGAVPTSKSLFMAALRRWIHPIFNTPTPTPTATATPTNAINPGIKNCVRAADFFTSPVTGLSNVNMGYVQVNEAQLADGTSVPLNIRDCSGDGILDIQIPWSESTAKQLSTIEFSANVCQGKAPQQVEIVLIHGTPIQLTAFDDTGAVVDTVSSSTNGMELFSLSSASGIRLIEIEGAEICILRICWYCALTEETPQPTSTPVPQYSPTPTLVPGISNCVTASNFYTSPVELAHVELGGIDLLPAVLPSGESVPIRITDCSGDGSLDIFIPWSDQTASPRATLYFSLDLCKRSLPTTVEIVLQNGNAATFFAYDSAGVLVDTESTIPGVLSQSVILTNASGIRRIEILGTQLCISKICWGCGKIEITPTPSTSRTWLSFDDKSEAGAPIQMIVEKTNEESTLLRYHIPGVWQSTVQYGGRQFTKLEFPEVGVLKGAGFDEGDEWYQFPRQYNYPPLDGNHYRNALSIRIGQPVFPEKLKSLEDLPDTAAEMIRLGIDPAGARPGIPVLAGLFAINPMAAGATISLVTLTKNTANVNLNDPLLPAGFTGLDQATNEDVDGYTPPSLIDETFYRQFKGSYTGPEDTLSDVSRAGAFSVMEMRMPLLNAQTGHNIKFYTDIEINIKHPGGVSRPDWKKQTDTIPWDTWINKPPVINGWAIRESLLNNGILIRPIRLARYLILTPSGYEAYLNQFIDWKESKGLAVDVAVVGDFEGADVAADRDAIDEYIEEYDDRYSWATVYVLIIGDRDLIPAGRSSRVVAGPDYSNADSDHVYAVHGSDRFASIYVGRLSVNGMPSELEAQLNKIISYEKGEVSGTWPKIASLLANSQNNDESMGVSSSHPSKYAAAVNAIASYGSYTNPPTFEVMHAGASNNSTPRAVNQNVIDALKAGRGQLLYRGHGNSSSWVAGWDGSSDYGNAFDSTNELPLVTNKVFPIIYSIACQNNRISVEDSFGEAWMKKAGAGSVAFWGASVNSYTSENHNRAKGIFRAIYESNETRLSPALAEAEQISWGLTGDTTSWDSNSFCYILLGDPEMTIRRNSILSKILYYNFEVLNNAVILKLSDEKGTPVPGALVNLHVGETMINGFTNNNGSLLLQDISIKKIKQIDIFAEWYQWLRSIIENPLPEPEPVLPDPIWVDDDNNSGTEDGSEAYPFNTIGEAMIEATTHTVRVRSGVYYENVVMKDGVKLIGAGADSTIIDGGGSGTAISCSNVGVSSLISGFRLQNSSLGIYCSSSSPRIQENVIANIDLDSLGGDGIRLRNSSPIIKNNLINGVGGMGIGASAHSQPIILNNTIHDFHYYAGISFASLDIEAVTPTVKNNIIIRGNSQPVAGILWKTPANVLVSYNDIYDVGNVTTGSGPSYYGYHNGTQWIDVAGGVGAISEDPLFVDPWMGSFYLLPDSPCIDAGDPNNMYNDDDGSRNDMGAYGGQRLESGENGHDGSGFIFTSVGRIPINEIVQNPFNPSYGLAVVSATAAADFSIPQYKDSPFGGVLWIRGLFGVNDPVDYYQILVRPVGTFDATALTSPLVKTRYVINPDGTVTTTNEQLGPQSVGGIDNLYQLNQDGIWSQEDLRMIWNTTGLNGRYILEYKAYRLTGTDTVEEVVLPANTQDHMTLWLDNTALDVKINEVYYADSTELAECEGIVFPHNGSTQLIFDITANHENGFLRWMVLDCYWGHDRFGGRFLYDQYEGLHDAPPPLWTGYSNTVLPPLSPMNTDGTVMPWENCAYRFRIYAEARTTDGYYYLRQASYSVYHDVQTLAGDVSLMQVDNENCPNCDEEDNQVQPMLTLLDPLEAVAAPTLPSSKFAQTGQRSVTPQDVGALEQDDFVDTWINIDSNTGGITHIEIARSGENMIVHAYGKCHPTDCDWGPLETPYTGNPFVAVYEQGFKTNTLTIELVDQDTLTVHSVNVFHDGTDRDYVADYTFRGNTIWVDDDNDSGIENGSTHYPFNTIPEGIAAAVSGQIVRVLPGLYALPVVMKNGVSVIGSGEQDTVIDLGGSGTAVYCVGIDSGTIFAGFKITHAGLGIYCHTSSLAIRENVICDIDYSSLAGDGIRLDNSSPLIRNNVIYHVGGMGIRGQGTSEPEIINNTIDDYGYYAGISFAALNIGAVSPIIKNNIVVRGNTKPVGGILWSAPSSPIVSYNDVYGVGNVTGGGSFYAYHDGTQWHEVSGGTGAISADPIFIDAANGYFYLDTTSPCIDAGDPAAVFNDNDESRNDMGAYGGQRLETTAPFHATTGFVFTGIGKVPITEIVKDTGNPSHGLLRVSDEVASDLSIPKFTDTAFGGVLWLHGLFGSSDDVDYYQILATPYGTSATAPLNEPLVKWNYTINPDGTVTSTRVQMGPLTVDGVSNLYLLNKDGYWSYTDLRYIWNTTGLNGKYNITVKAFRLSDSDTLEEVILPANELDHFTVWINNHAPEVSIDSITYADGTPIAECEKITFPHDDESSLIFTLTAWHPEGFLRTFSLNAYWGNNRDGGRFIADQYEGSNDGAPPVWNGWMTHTFEPLLPRDSAGQVVEWQNCAYHFSLLGTSRITNGVQYLHWIYDNVYQSVINLGQ